MTISGAATIGSSGISGGMTSGTDAATGNHVTIIGGTYTRSYLYIAGGNAQGTGNVSGNAVTVTGGTFNGNTYINGGYSYSGSATGNRVILGNGVSFTGDVSGGYAGHQFATNPNGSATGNEVFISSGVTVTGTVSGGAGYTTGDVFTGNILNMEGEPTGITTAQNFEFINFDYAGNSNITTLATSAGQDVKINTNGNAVNFNTAISGAGGISKTGADTLTLSGTNTYTGMTTVQEGTLMLGSGGIANSSGLTLYGDATFAHNGQSHALNGKVVNIMGANANYTGDLFAQNAALNFYLPTTSGTGDTMLYVSGNADIDGSTVNVGINGGSSVLQKGDEITLISSGSLSGAPVNSITNGQGMQGISLLYDFNLSTQDNQLIATIVSDGNDGDGDHPAHVNPQTKALSEGRIAGLAFASQGGDLIAGPGMAALVADTDKQAGSLTAFGVMSGGSSRYNTGSHVDVDGVSLMTGLGWRAPLAQNALRVGAFVEAGWGNYDSHNAFSNAASVKGSGDTHYYGLGMLARYELTDSALKGLYADASLRAGRTATDFSSNDLRDALGRIARYDSHSSYYGAHAGIGYVWPLNDQSSLDFSSKYLWTRQGSDAVTVVGDPVRFDAADSSRWRNGVRFSHTLATAAGKPLSVYAGAYYEHEFDGKVNATTYGYAIDAPELKGDTGIGELGLRYRPQAAGGFSLDAGIQGYVGDRRGMSGSVRMMYAF